MNQSYFEKVRRLFTENTPHCRELGMQTIRIEAGVAELTLQYRPEMLGSIEQGLIHGSVLTTLIDTASGMAACTVVGEAERVVTLDLRVDYMRPALQGDALFVRAKCYRLTRPIAFIRATAWQGDESHLVATAQSTFMRLGEAHDDASETTLQVMPE